MPFGIITVISNKNVKSKVLSCMNDTCLCKEVLLRKNGKTTIRNGICGHSYHTKCINKWIERVNSCPICIKKWEVY